MAHAFATALPNAPSVFARFRHVVGKPVLRRATVALPRQREGPPGQAGRAAGTLKSL